MSTKLRVYKSYFPILVTFILRVTRSNYSSCNLSLYKKKNGTQNRGLEVLNFGILYWDVLKQF